jgi:DNA-binding SARP family transcriptional activator/tetratricopeptide (TPR) repeat protein
LLWDDDSAARRHGLSQLLYQLKRRFPDLSLNIDGASIRLEPACVWVDALALLDAVDCGQHEIASELFKGRFLPDLFIRTAPGFEEWRTTTAARVENAATHALKSVLRDADAVGSWWVVERTAQRLLELDAYDETAHTALVKSIAASGDYSRAIRELDKTYDLFRRDLGQLPGREIRQLTSNLRLIGSGGATEAHPGPAEPRFVGRIGEFRVARAAWRAAAAGKGQSMLIHGEAGIGKSRLCSHLMRLAAIEGARVLWGKCFEASAQIPYSGISETLLSGARESDTAALPAVWREVLRGLLPELFGNDLTVVSPHEPQDEGGRRRLFEAIARLIITIAETCPVVVHLDDVHHADPSTLAVVQYLIRRTVDYPVLVMAGLRTSDIFPERTVHAALASFDANIGLLPMGLDEASQLLTSLEEQTGRFMETATKEAVLRRAGGIPLYLVELLRFVQTDHNATSRSFSGLPPALPHAIESVLVRRLSNLSRIANSIASSLAALGGHATRPILQRVADLSGKEMLAGLAELVHSHIAIEHGSRVGFSHPLLHEVAWAHTAPGARQELHERAASSLLALPTSRAGNIAIHMHAAGNDEQAHAFALQAASASRNMYAHAETEFFLRLAVATAQGSTARLDALDQLCEHYYGLSQYEAVRQILSELKPWYASTANQRGLLMTAVVELQAALAGGKTSVAELGRAVQEIADLVASASSVAKAAAAVGLIIEAANDAGHTAFVREFVNAIKVEAGRSAGAPVDARVLSACAKAEAVYVSAKMGRDTAERALHIARHCKDSGSELHALTAYATACTLHGDYNAAEGAFQEGLQVAARPGLEYYRQRIWNNYGVLMIEQGRFLDARKTFHYALPSASIHDQLFLFGNLGIVSVEMSDWDEAQRCAQHIQRANVVLQAVWPELIAKMLRAYAAIATNENPTASGLVDQVATSLAQGGRSGIADTSYIEILFARTGYWGAPDRTTDELLKLSSSCRETNAGGAARLDLEAARTLREIDPGRAAVIAKRVQIWAGLAGAEAAHKNALAIVAEATR